MISDLPERPANWSKVRFDEISKNITDRVDKPKESGLDYYIGLEHLDTDEIRIKRFGSTKDVEATKFLCNKNDIIFGKRRAYLRKLAISDRDAVVSAHSMILRPNGNMIVDEFLPCFMQSSIFWKTAHSISEGSMSPTIKWKTLAKQEFWIPPKEEQKKIAEILWAIEDNIEKTEKLIATTEKLKRGLLNELLTKGIGHTKFKKTELGEIPEEWELVNVGDICWVDNGKRNAQDAVPDGQYILFDRSKTIKKSNKYIFDCEAVIIPGEGQDFLPRHFNGKFDLHQRAYAIGSNSTNKIIILYLYYWFLQHRKHFLTVAVGSTVKSLRMNHFTQFPLLLPRLQEQEQIVNIMKRIDNKLNINCNHLELLNRLKKKLTNEFMTGKIRVPVHDAVTVEAL